MGLPEAKYFRMSRKLKQWIQTMARKERRTEQEVIVHALEFYHEYWHTKKNWSWKGGKGKEADKEKTA